MASYIVECLSCQQPWEVPTRLLTTPEQRILVPAHMMLNPATSEREPRPCAGAVFSGIGMGERGQWEHDWPSAHPGRPLPVVVVGSTSVTLQVAVRS
jgi:hypothetical protein